VLCVDVVSIAGHIAATVLFVAAGVHAMRLWRWKPWRTRKVPLVWVLHVSYGWIVVYLVLRGFAEIGSVSRLFAVHALTVGVIGGMTIGMMTRAARGPGRLLVATGAEVSCFVLVSLAAASVFSLMILPTSL
jgi:uncharacterized protein involved in response to NO